MLDSTSLWVFVKKHDQRVMRILLGVALFLAGWQLGRVMSPYYATQPIVFEDRQCSACSSSGGSVSQLEDLRAAGVAMQEDTKAPTVAGVTSGVEGQQFVASKNSTLYHHVSCSTVSRIKAENRVWFASADEARSAGLSPSQCAVDLGY